MIDDLNQEITIFKYKTTLMKYCLIYNKQKIVHYLLHKGVSLAQNYTLHEEHPLVNFVINDNLTQLKKCFTLTHNKTLRFSPQNLHEALDYAFMFAKLDAIDILLSQKQVMNSLSSCHATLGIIDVDNLILLINKYHHPEFLFFVKREITVNSSLFSQKEIDKITQALLVFDEKKYFNQLLNKATEKEVTKI
jgi:hypothetical protein